MTQNPSRRFAVATRVGVGASSIALVAAGMSAPVAAVVTCSSTAPALDESVTCTGDGVADVTVPAGANAVTAVVSGAGGGAGYGATGGVGGVGARVQAEFLISSLSFVRVAVGAAGAGGGATNAGSGGGFSALYRGKSSVATDVLVVAGGGGGGQGVASGTGGAGGAGAALGTAAGGNGASSGGSAVFAGGADGSGNGGIAGTYCDGVPGSAGQSWSDGGAGGAGYSATTGGGSGGAGYGGGGGGSQYGSGGAGGSYADATYLNGSAVFSAAGGAGGTVTASAGGIGAGGTVVITFRSTAGSGSSSSSSNVAQTREIVWQGAGTETTSTIASMNSWVKTPTTSESGREGDRLLGWSTTPDFPLDIAARQVSNGWGAYELFNSNGSIRSVFIPAGSFTFISFDSTMHAIWSSGQLMQRC